MLHPADSRNREQHYRYQHTMRVMAGMAVSLLLLVAVVKLWPVPGDDAGTDIVYTTKGPETIQIEEIVQTSQRRQTPPPPAPLPPIIIPNDQIIEDDFNLDFTDSFLPIDEPGLDQRLTPGDPIGAETVTARAETGPKPVRITEPKYPRAAEKKKIRAEVVIEVLIDEQGNVEASKIIERFLLGNDDDPRQPVAQLGYGLEEAALDAAESWFFRPARQNGTPVRSRHELTFKFGV